MRIPSKTKSLWLLLLISIPQISSSTLSPRNPTPDADTKQLASNEATVKSSTPAPAKVAGDGVGTKDAPVDGKDGRPHMGPFVETSAERDRKKAKENGEDVSTKKLPPKEMPSGAPKDTMPETNDGVMDDPNRQGPKEGTRGTEGGISGKGKDGIPDIKSEKIPDPPKEQPPLPHSEQQTLEDKSSAKDDGNKDKEKAADGSVPGDDKKKDEKKKEETIKEPGGLEVRPNLNQSSLQFDILTTHIETL